MSFVLTVSSQIQCAHNGVVAVSSAAKLSVAGSKVLTLDGIINASIACMWPTDTNGDKTCTMVTAATGVSTKLNVGGQPVALDTLTGNSDGAPPPPPPGPPLLPAVAGQSKLTA